MKERFNKSANCLEISFLEEIMFCKVSYVGQKPYQGLERILCWLFFLYQYVSETLYYHFHLKDSLKNVYVNILCCFVVQL